MENGFHRKHRPQKFMDSAVQVVEGPSVEKLLRDEVIKAIDTVRRIWRKRTRGITLTRLETDCNNV